jgi:hypothetical protein
MGVIFFYGVATSSCGSCTLGFVALSELFFGGTSSASFSSCEGVGRSPRGPPTISCVVVGAFGYNSFFSSVVETFDSSRVPLSISTRDIVSCFFPAITLIVVSMRNFIFYMSVGLPYFSIFSI